MYHNSPNNDQDTMIIELKVYDILSILLLTLGGVFVYNVGMGMHMSIIFILTALPILITFGILIICDFKYFILPNPFTYFLIIYGLLINSLSAVGIENIGFTSLQQSLWGTGLTLGLSATIRLLFNYILGKESFGLGDVKMLGGIGAIFGSMFLLQTIFFASILGIIYYIIYSIISPKKGRYIPYGSCLGLTCILPPNLLTYLF